MVAGNVHLLFLGCLSAFVIVPEIVWQRKCHILIFTKILHWREPISMASFVVDKKDERLFLVTLFQPFYTLVRNDIRTISLFNRRFSILMQESGVIVFSLSDKDFIMIETRWLTYQMPLSDKCRLIARFLKQLGHCLLRTVKDAMFVVGKTILMAMLARKHARTRRSAQRVCHKTF